MWCHDCPHRHMGSVSGYDVTYTGRTETGEDVENRPVSQHPCHNQVSEPCVGMAAMTFRLKSGKVKKNGDLIKLTASNSNVPEGCDHLRFPLEFIDGS